MVIAILFNADDPKYGGNYGDSIRKTILETGVLQEANRKMKVSLGDVLFYSYAETREQLSGLAEKTFFGHPGERLLSSKLRSVYANSTVFAWVVQNVTDVISEKMHNSLMSRSDASYLGIHQVDFAYPLHLVFYKSLMVEKYMIVGDSCKLLYSLGDQDETNDGDVEEMRKLGFANVAWEDNGARGTVFDDFDTTEHFAQVDECIGWIAGHASDGECSAFEFAMILSDLNPKLFDVLGAATRAIGKARNEEEVAQAALYQVEDT